MKEKGGKCYIHVDTLPTWRCWRGFQVQMLCRPHRVWRYHLASMECEVEMASVALVASDVGLLCH